MKNRIYIIGMGPGKEEMMTVEALEALEASDAVSYTHLDVYKRQIWWL